VAEDLLECEPPPRDLLADKGFAGAAFAAAQAAQAAQAALGTAVLILPAKGQRGGSPASGHLHRHRVLSRKCATPGTLADSATLAVPVAEVLSHRDGS
jgi:hypothetical protein